MPCTSSTKDAPPCSSIASFGRTSFATGRIFTTSSIELKKRRVIMVRAPKSLKLSCWFDQGMTQYVKPHVRRLLQVSSAFLQEFTRTTSRTVETIHHKEGRSSILPPVLSSLDPASYRHQRVPCSNTSNLTNAAVVSISCDSPRNHYIGSSSPIRGTSARDQRSEGIQAKALA